MSSDFDQLQGCFYNLVKEYTEVIVLFQAIDWFLSYSMLRDKYSVKWHLNYEVYGQYNLKTRNKKKQPFGCFFG